MNRSLAPTALMLGNFVTGLAVVSPTGMLGDLAGGLSVSVYQAGLLITFGAVVLCIGSPLTVWLTSRMDRRLLLACIMIGVAIGYGASSLVNSYGGLMALRLITVAIVAPFTPLAAGTASSIVPRDKIPGTIVFVFLGWSLAFAFGMPLVTYTAAHLGWRGTFAGLSGFALMVSILLTVGVPAGLAGTPVELKTWIALGRNRLVLLLLLITTFQVSGQFCIFTYLGPLLSRLIAASPEIISVSFGIFGVCGLIGNILAMRIVGVIGPFSTSGIFLAALLVASVTWIAGTASADTIVMFVSVAFWGFGFAAMNSMQQTRLVQAAPSSASAAVALNTSVLYVGQAIGSALGGKLFAREQFDSVGYASVAFIVAAIVVLYLTRPRPLAALN